MKVIDTLHLQSAHVVSPPSVHGNRTAVAREVFPRECPQSDRGLDIGRCYSRPLSGGRLHDDVDGSIAFHAVGAPLRPHAGERHGDLSPSGRHPNSGRRGRRGGSRRRAAPLHHLISDADARRAASNCRCCYGAERRAAAGQAR